MKKLFVLLCALISINAANAQGCLPEGIIFVSQKEIDHFYDNHPGCTKIEGNVNISGDSIINLNGLSVLQSIIGDLAISNTLLQDLSGLQNLTFIGKNMQIYGNPILANLSGLNNISAIGGNMEIGLIQNGNPSLTSLDGLNGLSSIEGSINIVFNPVLTDMTGLENLTSVTGDFQIQDNTNLSSLAGLNSLISVEGKLGIGWNNSLTSLIGLDNLTSVGHHLGIAVNNALVSLNGLHNLTSIGGELEIFENPNLTSILEIENINAASIQGLYVYNNASLSNCEVQSLCNYLVSPVGTIIIDDNASGCNSIEEVKNACAQSIEEAGLENSLSLFPNPANQTISISTKNGSTIDKITIYNQTGQIVLREIPESNTIDVSKLRPGMYVVEVKTSEWVAREKLVVE